MPAKKKEILEQPKAPSELALPTAEAVAAARAKRKDRSEQSQMAPCQVLGLPEGWRAAILDPGLPDGQIAAISERWTAKGWIRLDGLQTVTGFPSGAYVFVKTEEDFQAAIRERAAKIEAARKAGMMH